MSHDDHNYWCLLETAHVYKACKVIVIHHIIISLIFSYIFFPYVLPLTIAALLTCVSAAHAVFYSQQARLLLPFQIYVYISLLLLAYLDGYMFFISIFNKYRHQDVSGCPRCHQMFLDVLGVLSKIGARLHIEDPGTLSIIVHMFDIFSMLFHFWNIPIISKTKQYLIMVSKVEGTTRIRSQQMTNDEVMV